MSTAAEAATARWLEELVIGLNLCPFAKKELLKQSIRITVCNATDNTALLEALVDEISLLDKQASIETTLLVLPNALADFLDFNDFLGEAEHLIAGLDREGVYQLASFHPNYQFAGTQPTDAENFTNRSPYPTLHLLREDSVSDAVDKHPDTASIPEHNIALMNDLGTVKLQHLLDQLKKGASDL